MLPASKLLPAAVAMAACAATARTLPARHITPPPATATVGRKAPAFQFTDQDGRRFRLGDHLGRQPIVLVFYRGPW